MYLYREKFFKTRAFFSKEKLQIIVNLFVHNLLYFYISQRWYDIKTTFHIMLNVVVPVEYEEPK